MDVYRVTVRGKFVGLSDRTRSWLVAEVDAHDIMRSSFTEEGTFTYDNHLQFFNLRYEVRISDAGKRGTAAGDPAAVALREAELFLKTLSIGHGPLRAAVMDMSAMMPERPPA